MQSSKIALNSIMEMLKVGLTYLKVRLKWDMDNCCHGLVAYMRSLFPQNFAYATNFSNYKA